MHVCGFSLSVWLGQFYWILVRQNSSKYKRNIKCATRDMQDDISLRDDI